MNKSFFEEGHSLDGSTPASGERGERRDFVLSAEYQGQRLDFVLKSLGIESGLRANRRLCESGLVLLNGKAARAADKVRSGDALSVLQPFAAQEGPDSWPEGAQTPDEPPEISAVCGELIFIYKPRGLHCAALAGRPGQASLEALLPMVAPHSGFTLLSRLDKDTSGLVAAAGNERLMREWRAAESAGACRKFYCALLEGHLGEEILIKNSLKAAKRVKTGVLPYNDPDRARHTLLTPLAWFEAHDILGLNPPLGSVFTLAGCLIRRGARHQIRVHAAHSGHPLAGDMLYGAQTSMPFSLHHGHIISPFGSARRGAPIEDFLPLAAREKLQEFWK